DRHQGRQLQIAGALVDKWQRPEEPDATDDGPARQARMRVAEIEEYADGLRKRRSRQMRKDEVLRQPTLGAFQLGFSRNEPVDEPDYAAPYLHSLRSAGLLSPRTLARPALKIGLAMPFQPLTRF